MSNHHLLHNQVIKPTPKKKMVFTTLITKVGSLNFNFDDKGVKPKCFFRFWFGMWIKIVFDNIFIEVLLVAAILGELMIQCFFFINTMSDFSTL